MSWKVGLEILYVWVSEHFVSASGCISDAGTDAETRLLFVSKNYKFDISQDTPPTHCLLRIIRFCLCRHSHYDQAWFNCYKCQGAYVPARNVRGGEEREVDRTGRRHSPGATKGANVQCPTHRASTSAHQPHAPNPDPPLLHIKLAPQMKGSAHWKPLVMASFTSECPTFVGKFKGPLVSLHTLSEQQCHWGVGLGYFPPVALPSTVRSEGTGPRLPTGTMMRNEVDKSPACVNLKQLAHSISLLVFFLILPLEWWNMSHSEPSMLLGFTAFPQPLSAAIWDLAFPSLFLSLSCILS